MVFPTNASHRQASQIANLNWINLFHRRCRLHDFRYQLIARPFVLAEDGLQTAASVYDGAAKVVADGFVRVQPPELQIYLLGNRRDVEQIARRKIPVPGIVFVTLRVGFEDFGCVVFGID